MLALFLLACPMTGDDSSATTCEPVSQVDANREPGASPSGWEWCHPRGSLDGGSFRRVSAETCLTSFADLAPACTVSDGHNVCEVDADCGGGNACVTSPWGSFTCECVTPCSADADCGADELCLCAAELSDEGMTVQLASYPACHPASCRGAADCDGDCRAGFGICQSPLGDIACATSQDGCTMDADCPGYGPLWCDYDGASWHCEEYAICD